MQINVSIVVLFCSCLLSAVQCYSLSRSHAMLSNVSLEFVRITLQSHSRLSVINVNEPLLKIIF